MWNAAGEVDNLVADVGSAYRGSEESGSLGPSLVL